MVKPRQLQAALEAELQVSQLGPVACEHIRRRLLGPYLIEVEPVNPESEDPDEDFDLTSRATWQEGLWAHYARNEFPEPLPDVTPRMMWAVMRARLELPETALIAYDSQDSLTSNWRIVLNVSWARDRFFEYPQWFVNYVEFLRPVSFLTAVDALALV